MSLPYKITKALIPIHLLALVDIGVFSLLSIMNGVFDAIPLILGVSIALLTYYSYYLLTLYKMGDTYIVSIVSMLFSLGLMMQYRLSQETGIRQFGWFLIGTVVFFIGHMIFSRFHKHVRSLWLFYGLMVLLFIVTLLFGSEVNGAKNWIIIGSLSLQPSELVKILFVFFMAAYTSNPEALELKWMGLHIKPKWVLMVLVFVLLGFFVLQREFGTALLVFMVYLSFLYVFEHALLFAIGNGLLALMGAAIATQFVTHLQVRIDSWINPWSDISGKGYQITQSLFAIGSGGFFGTGIGLGYPKYIPNVQTDFIYSALCEEMGIFGGLAVMLLFFMLVYRGIKIALRLENRYSKALGFGLTITLGYQTFIIIGGVIKLIPLTGITLPFVSYGGSSLITSYIVLSLLQALSGPILREEVALRETILHQ